MEYVENSRPIEEMNTASEKKHGGRKATCCCADKLNLSTLSHLRYFYEVVRLSSFTLAAKECDVSQSAISQHIQALEKEIGAKLISRSGRKVMLTPAGRYFYDRSKAVVADYERLCSETRRIDGNDKKTLCIGYLRICDGLEVHHAVSDFSRRHPECNISTVETNTEELLELLRKGIIDVAVCEQYAVCSDEFESSKIAAVNSYVEISGNSPFAEGETVDMDELKYLRAILIANEDQRERVVNHFRTVRKFENSFLFAETLREARMMAVSGKGFVPIDGFGSENTLKPSIARLQLTSGGTTIRQNYCIFRNKGGKNADADEFAEILRSYCNG